MEIKAKIKKLESIMIILYQCMIRHRKLITQGFSQLKVTLLCLRPNLVKQDLY